MTVCHQRRERGKANVTGTYPQVSLSLLPNRSIGVQSRQQGSLPSSKGKRLNGSTRQMVEEGKQRSCQRQSRAVPSRKNETKHDKKREILDREGVRASFWLCTEQATSRGCQVGDAIAELVVVSRQCWAMAQELADRRCLSCLLVAYRASDKTAISWRRDGACRGARAGRRSDGAMAMAQWRRRNNDARAGRRSDAGGALAQELAKRRRLGCLLAAYRASDKTAMSWRRDGACRSAREPGD
ncbi:hypothetical protein QBC39DRAFT_42543 [Podospora conica]|nr:hypothetical protein QBC39DRAFT_42543 [Schizothecium conicum]